MKDEIKEILDILKKCYNLKDENFDNYISLYQLGLLLDYITNLQEENKRLLVELNQNMIERNNYLSRNEKAIEKIKDLYSYADNEEYVDNYCKDLLNILQGSEENDNN